MAKCLKMGSGNTKTLLWENKNSNSTFSPQTLDFDISKYSAIKIVYKLSVLNTNEGTGLFEPNSLSSLSSIGYISGILFVNTEVTPAKYYCRVISITEDNKLYIGNGYLPRTNITDNQYLIPLKIYGY